VALASPPARRRAVASLLTPTRITTALACCLALFLVVAADLSAGLLFGGYLALVLVTASVMRGVRHGPGGWLAQRLVRRCLVVLILGVCVVLTAVPPLPKPSPTTASGPGPIVFLFLVLVGLNIALGRATQRIAAAPDSAVDERQEALRNRAHTIAYVIYATVVGGTAVIADMASSNSRAWLEGSLSTGGGFITLLELLFVLPAMVLAFIDTGPVSREPLDQVRDRTCAAAGRRRS